MRLFKNRLQAASELASDLAYLKEQQPVVLALPNDGVPIAAVIAERLDAPLDILLIARLAAPGHGGAVVGAVDEHGRISMIQGAARWQHVTAQQLIAPARAAFAELQHRRARYRAILAETELRGRVVVIVDQGVRTGTTMLAAVASVRDRGARHVVVAAPAGYGKAAWQLRETADTVVIPHTPSQLKGIEHCYEALDEVTDQGVEQVLARWAAARPHHHPGVRTLVLRVISGGTRVLHCELDLPPGMTRGSGPFPAVIFAHDREGDGRSPHTVPISRRLAKRQVIGVRPDLTGHGRSEGRPEDATEECLLADLRAVLENVRILQEIDPARIGLSGAGTGGGLALRFAETEPAIAAIVVRGPLAGGELDAARRGRAPTLVIHGEHDPEVARLAQAPGAALPSIHQLLVVPESNRGFNDPVSHELMVGATVDWLVDHVAGTGYKSSATRNPLVTRLAEGGAASRSAARQPAGGEANEPPRSTRVEALPSPAAPTGSTASSGEYGA
jgi:putative phosphoribosyl transferase